MGEVTTTLETEACGLAVLLPGTILDFPHDLIGMALVLIGVIFVASQLLQLLKIARPPSAQEQRAVLSADIDPRSGFYIAPR